MPQNFNSTNICSGPASAINSDANIPVAIADGAGITETNDYQVTANSGSSAALTCDTNGNNTGDGTNTYVWDADN